MRSIFAFALIVMLGVVGFAVLNRIAIDTPADTVVMVSMPVAMTDGTVAMWTAPVVHPVALADAMSAPAITSDLGVPVTDLGGSARAGEPVALKNKDNYTAIFETPSKITPLFRRESRWLTYNRNLPVTDLVT